MKNRLAAAGAAALLAAIVAAAAPAETAPAPEYAAAREAFLRDWQDSRGEARARVADALAVAYADAAEAEACDLLVRLLSRELAQRRETDIRQGVLDACVRGLRRARSAKVIDALVRLTSRTDVPWRMRMALLRALGGLREPKAVEIATRLAEDRSPALRAAALDALAEMDAKGAVPVVARALAAPAWELKVAAAAALRQLGDEAAVGPLILALRDPGDNPGRVLSEVTEALQAITGESHGYDAAAWVKYWMRRARETGAPAALPALSPTDVNTLQIPRWTAAFFGIPTPSTRVVFVIDISGSMKDPAVPDPDRPTVTTGRPRVVSSPRRLPPAEEAARLALDARRQAWAPRAPATKLEQVQQELILAILDMDPRVQFSLVCYGGERVEVWNDALVPAVPANQLRAIETVEKLRADGGTNTMDALYAAYAFLGRETAKGRPPAPVARDSKRKEDDVAAALRMNGVDTVYLLTDGKPNSGAVHDPAHILEEVRKVNDIRRVRVHVVGVGEAEQGVDPPDPEWCRRLAQESGGTFKNLIRTRAGAVASATPGSN
jgi:Mg-chelatase subunit ChlD